MKRVLSFRTPEEKACWLDSAAGIDSLDPVVKRAARKLVSGVKSDLHCIERIHRFVRDSIHYLRDVPSVRLRVVGGRPRLDVVRGEQLADSATIIKRGFDDCDGKSRLLVALVRAASRTGRPELEAKILPIFAGNDFVHVQAIARGSDTEKHPFSEPGGWLLCETTLRGVPLGAGAELAERDEGEPVVS